MLDASVPAFARVPFASDAALNVITPEYAGYIDGVDIDTVLQQGIEDLMQEARRGSFGNVDYSGDPMPVDHNAVIEQQEYVSADIFRDYGFLNLPPSLSQPPKPVQRALVSVYDRPLPSSRLEASTEAYSLLVGMLNSLDIGEAQKLGNHADPCGLNSHPDTLRILQLLCHSADVSNVEALEKGLREETVVLGGPWQSRCDPLLLEALCQSPFSKTRPLAFLVARLLHIEVAQRVTMGHGEEVTRGKFKWKIPMNKTTNDRDDTKYLDTFMNHLKTHFKTQKNCAYSSGNEWTSQLLVYELFLNLFFIPLSHSVGKAMVLFDITKKSKNDESKDITQKSKKRKT